MPQMRSMASRRMVIRRGRDSSRGSARSAAPYRRRPRLQPLEDRRLLAAISVTTELDTVNAGDGVNSLREAVTQANLAAGHDTITFDNSLVNKPVNLQSGQMTITDTVTIQGLGAALTTLDGLNNSRLFDITGGAGHVTFAGLTLTRGRTTGNNVDFNDTTHSGGAIRSLATGNLTLTDSVVRDNITTGIYTEGAGIWAAGSVTLTQSTVSGNTISGSSGEGAGIWTSGSVTLTQSTVSGNSLLGYDGNGGGIFSLGAVALTDSTVSGNSTAGDGADGGGIFSTVSVTLTQSTVSGNSTFGAGAFGGGIFSLGAVTLTDSTVSGNSTSGTSDGGGILSFGNVMLTQSTVQGNSGSNRGGGIWTNAQVTLTQSSVSGNSSVGRGGGIFSLGGVTLTNSTISGNSASSIGGGVYSRGGVTLNQSTVSGNSTSGIGGGIYSRGGAATLAQSTLSGNTANLNGGGILSRTGVTLNQSTVSGNRSLSSDGGGIVAYGVTLSHSTVTANSAAGYGGGIENLVNPAVVTGSIIALNTAGSGNPDLAWPFGIGTLTVNYSLIGDTSGSGITLSTGTGNVLDKDPLLGPLADNGGPTKTHALFAGSPAIDAGDPAALAGMGGVPLNDQRRAPFTRVSDGDVAGGAQIDIGAYERQTVAGMSLVVDMLVDDNDGDYSAADRSLREMIGLANGSVGPPETITFDAALTSGGPVTILLTRGELAINDSLTINGPGANLLTIDASGNDPTHTTNNGDGSRVFSIDDGNSTPDKSISIVGLTLTGGDVSSSGGAVFCRETFTMTGSVVSGNNTMGTASSGGGIYSLGAVTLNQSTISGNNSGGSGGGIFSRGGVTLNECTVSGNSTVASFASGGGIFAFGSALLTQTTVTGNSSPNRGGGIFSADSITLTQSTVSQNTGSGGGGGIRIQNGAAVIRGSIVAANTGSTSPDLLPGAGGFTVNYSLIGNTNNSGITLATGTGNLLNVNALLGPLADNGGPTKTHALLAGSPAVDAGDPAAVAGVGGVPLNDQRGAPFGRVFDGDGAGGARIDIGAYERQTVAGLSLVVDTLADESDGNYVAGDRSLREMIGLANGSVGADTITFAASLTSGGPATIRLTLGELQISESATIDGPGAELLTIDASGNDPTPTVNEANGSRVINVNDFTHTRQTVSISGLTLTGADFTFGGAIWSEETLAVTSCTINDNSANLGGGIYSYYSNLTVTGSTINGNSAYLSGGGIQLVVGNLTLTNSTISDNSANFGGGGIVNHGGELSITRSRIESNFAYDGGGISNTASGNATITDSTIAGNRARYGGGISHDPGNLTISGSTISGNTADRQGGGILTETDFLGHLTTIVNSTISGNTAGQLGGGLFNAAGKAVISHSTISNNSAPSATGGGVALRGNNATETQFYSCIIAGASNGGDLVLHEVDASVAIAGNLLVDLRAESATAGSANWTNLGTLGGTFAEVGDPSAVTVGGVTYVQFDANEAYRGPTAPASITGASDRTIEAWVLNFFVATDDTVAAWGHRGGPPGTNMAFNYGTNATWGAADHWGTGITWGASPPIANALHHLVYTYDGTTERVYADGALYNSSVVALNTHALATDTINVMAQNSAAGQLEFILADGMDVAVLRVHDGALTAADILNNFNAGVTAVVQELPIISAGYNLVGTGNASDYFKQQGDTTGETNPALGPLADNGGPTKTHALLVGSPAIDAGDPAAVAGMGNVPLYDQRGMPFGRVVDGNGDSVARIDIGAFERLVAPAITALRVGSSAWSSTFKTFVDPALGLGYTVLASAAPLPWMNLNQLFITFSQPVEQPNGEPLTASDVAIRGVNRADYNTLVQTFAYDAGTATATFTFNQSIAADKLLVFIDHDAVADTAGTLLAADFSFRLDVLPGDADRSGAVLGNDVGQVRLKQFSAIVAGTPSANYSIFHDVDGSGSILGNDVGATRLRQFSVLPPSEPSAPGAGAALSSAAVDDAFESWGVLAVQTTPNRSPPGRAAARRPALELFRTHDSTANFRPFWEGQEMTLDLLVFDAAILEAGTCVQPVNLER